MCWGLNVLITPIYSGIKQITQAFVEFLNVIEYLMSNVLGLAEDDSLYSVV